MNGFVRNAVFCSVDSDWQQSEAGVGPRGHPLCLLGCLALSSTGGPYTWTHIGAVSLGQSQEPGVTLDTNCLLVETLFT